MTVTTQFPIPQFIRVTPDTLTDAVNQFITDVNGVVVQNGGGSGAPGYVTRRSLFTALNLLGYLPSLSVAIEALGPTSQVWIDYRTQLTVPLNGPLANYIQGQLGWTTDQMASLWLYAAQQTQ